MIGVIFENVYLGLGIYSLVSTLMILYSLIWYYTLVKRNEPESGIGQPLNSYE